MPITNITPNIMMPTIGTIMLKISTDPRPSSPPSSEVDESLSSCRIDTGWFATIDDTLFKPSTCICFTNSPFSMDSCRVRCASRAESSSGKSEAVTLTSTLVCASRLREMICRGLTATTWTRDAEIDSTLDTATVARSAPLVVSNSLKVSPFSCKSASTEKVLVDGAAPEVRDGFIRRVGEAVGLPVGTSVGVAVGFAVGFAVGVPVGVPVGVAEGVAVGAPEGSPPPEAVGPPAVSVGDELTFEVGEPPGTGLCKGLEGEAMHTASAWH
mmetsp:Transcript_43783/g.83592  ORF Transcript_43783/g.83592 Transcript_43783/m.83592 type:complete len:270 (+) Transcript_43783:1159-1968(+)